jgi:hypothetical protein
MNRRRKKYIRPDMQLKVVLITFFAASFLLLVNFQLDIAGLWSLSSKLAVTGGGAQAALDETRRLVIEKFLITFGLSVPLTVSIGILYSFSFSGPVYRFQKYFNDLAAGRWDSRCQLRRGDGLQDVCESINEAMDSVWAQLLEDLRLLQDSRALLDQVAPADGEAAERWAMLKDRITKVIALHEERLGLRKRPAEPAAAAPPVKETQLETA